MEYETIEWSNQRELDFNVLEKNEKIEKGKMEKERERERERKGKRERNVHVRAHCTWTTKKKSRKVRTVSFLYRSTT